jgi:hypothetical protein
LGVGNTNSFTLPINPKAFLSFFTTESPNLGSIYSPPVKDGSNGENGSIEPTSGGLFSFFFLQERG